MQKISETVKKLSFSVNIRLRLSLFMR